MDECVSSLDAAVGCSNTYYVPVNGFRASAVTTDEEFAGGGAMMDLGCYPLHWALTIMGEAPSDVRATANLTPTGVDEDMNAELAFASGAVARLQQRQPAGRVRREDGDPRRGVSRVL